MQVEHALQLHTTDNMSVITVCFRDAPPPPRRANREVCRHLHFERLVDAGVLSTSVAAEWIVPDGCFACVHPSIQYVAQHD